jgi:hypothetical protein
MDFEHYSSVLVGRSLLYFMSANELIVEYDWDRHSLRVFETPDETGFGEECTLMLADGGGLGLTELTEGLNPQLKLWSREASDATHDDAQWVLSRVISLQELLPVGSLLNCAGLLVLGFAEGPNAIFVQTAAGLFMIELQSERVKKVCDDYRPCRLIPVVNFYTPVLRNRHQDLPFATEVAGGPGGEKTVDQAQQLFDSGFKEGIHQRFRMCQPCPDNRSAPISPYSPSYKLANVWNVLNTAPN